MMMIAVATINDHEEPTIADTQFENLRNTSFTDRLFCPLARGTDWFYPEASTRIHRAYPSVESGLTSQHTGPFEQQSSETPCTQLWGSGEHVLLTRWLTAVFHGPISQTALIAPLLTAFIARPTRMAEHP